MSTRATLILIVGILTAPSVAAQTQPRLDSLGDPLPEGASARLGTTRLKHDPGLNGFVDVALLSPDGSKIVSLSRNIHLWDAVTGKEISGPWREANKGFFTAVAFSPDGSLLAAATGRGPRPGLVVGKAARKTLAGEIIVYDIARSQVVKTVPNVTHYVRGLGFADEGKTLVSAGEGTVSWWDLESGKEKRVFHAFPGETQTIENGTKTKTFFNCVLGPDARSIAVQAAWQIVYKQPVQQRFEQYEQHEAVGIDLATGKTVWRMNANGPRGDVARFAFSGDGKRVAVGLEENKVEVRDAVNGKLVTAPVNANASSRFGGLALTADGNRLAIAAGDGNVTVWNLNDGASAVTFAARKGWYQNNALQRLQFSRDDKTLLLVLSAGIQLYDVATQREVHSWEGHDAWVDGVMFSGDGKKLLTTSGIDDKRSEQSIYWDAAVWKRVQTILGANPRWPNLIVASPDQTVYAGKSDDGRLGLYSMVNGKLLARFTVPSGQKINARSFFSPSGKLFVLASRDDRGKDIERVYAIPSGKALCQLPALDRNDGFAGSAQPVVFSANERLVALVGEDDQRIYICETATGKIRHRLGKEISRQRRVFYGNESAANLAFSRDGKLLASSVAVFDPETNTFDNPARVWDLATGKELIEIKGARNPLGFRGGTGSDMCLAWSPDNRVLAVGHNKIRLWELATHQVRRELPGHPDARIRALAYSPDGRVLASGSADTTVLIWDMMDKDRAANPPRGQGEMAQRWRTLAEDDAARAYAAIRDLAAAPDESVTWIKQHIKPAEAIAPAHIEELISQLDNDQFKTRQKATTELLRLGERALPALDQALAGTPTLETSLRLQDLRKRATSLLMKGAKLQNYRGMEVLERIGTPQARDALQGLADGADGAQVTVQARAALERLAN